MRRWGLAEWSALSQRSAGPITRSHPESGIWGLVTAIIYSPCPGRGMEMAASPFLSGLTLASAVQAEDIQVCPVLSVGAQNMGGQQPRCLHAVGNAVATVAQSEQQPLFSRLRPNVR